GGLACGRHGMRGYEAREDPGARGGRHGRLHDRCEVHDDPLRGEARGDLLDHRRSLRGWEREDDQIARGRIDLVDNRIDRIHLERRGACRGIGIVAGDVRPPAEHQPECDSVATETDDEDPESDHTIRRRTSISRSFSAIVPTLIRAYSWGRPKEAMGRMITPSCSSALEIS